MSAQLAVPDTAIACGCDVKPHMTAAQRTEEVRKELRQARAVFSGEVIGRSALAVRFKVDAVWKGDIPAEFAMWTGAVIAGQGLQVSTCDVSFRTSERYVVFAYGTTLQNMKAESCGLTGSFPFASETAMFLDTLAQGRTPVGPNSQRGIAVFGAVSKQGLVEWTEGMTVADAIARAGGYDAKAAIEAAARTTITRYPGNAFEAVQSVTFATRLVENDNLWVGRDLK